jgi:hypothetical protein
LKTLKEFYAEKKSATEEVAEEIVSRNLETLEAVKYVSESFSESADKHPMDPPAVLIMRRKSVRQFPNNQRVALYYVDKIDKYVTVPYTAMQWSSTGAMDVEE